eukprot:8684129-Pyramimonas_sp.AAC.1
MSAVDALGSAIVMRSSVLNIIYPNMTIDDADPSLCRMQRVTDCASLYDTIHREGAVTLPTERRCVLDLIGLRELFEDELCED